MISQQHPQQQPQPQQQQPQHSDQQTPQPQYRTQPNANNLSILHSLASGSFSQQQPIPPPPNLAGYHQAPSVIGAPMQSSGQQQQPMPPHQLNKQGQQPYPMPPPMTQSIQTAENDKVFSWILELMHGNNVTREQALLELGKKREQYEDLALILWNSFGVMTSLLQEIIFVYPLLDPPLLTSSVSNRVCNALALLQCVASHNDTRILFLNAHMPLFLYPFLNTTSKSRSFEYLRLTSLGVIGALVKNDSSDVIAFLLKTEIIPLCLRIMETGTELSKTVAIFIVQKILMDNAGLEYVCATYERFVAVSNVLANMVNQLVDVPASRLLKHVVRCYLRLSDNPRAREALRQTLPEPLRDATFSHTLRDDVSTKRCLAQLLANLSDNYE
ncbi:protein Caf40p [Trichomonascus vanleenenianus]|uniref:CCR4-NOT core subunit CAF40 n=1 Tax=Trichomonascus vanleenenianus TaxID=2268995 RepID=UPI003ECB0CDC